MRVAGVEIPPDKQIIVSLTYIYGIGYPSAKRILDEVGISPYKRAKDLTQEEVEKIKRIIETKYKVEGELRREVMMNIKRLKEIKCWRGLRHIKGLPVRGQTTRKNSRTVRGNIRRTVTSGKRKPPAPK